jgi:hypothetical protein
MSETVIRTERLGRDMRTVIWKEIKGIVLIAADARFRRNRPILD